MTLMMQGSVGDRVRRLRIARGIGQVELAERLGMASGAASMLENGRWPIDDQLLPLLGEVLDCAPTYFGAPPLSPVTTRPWLRAYADASKKAVDRTVADSVLAVEAAELLSLRRAPDVMPLFEGELADDDAIEQFALEVRATAELDEGDVVRNCIRAAERLGCIVLPMDDELGRHLGLSIRVDGNAVIRASRSSEDPERAVPGDRQRFTVAHEIGHLALHHNCPPPDTAADAARYEKQAHRFAAAFLAPADAILQDLNEFGGRVTLTTLANLKQRWGVAIKMLVMRFQQLGIIDDEHARSLYKQISARKWNKTEPVPVGNEDARWLVKALARRVSSTEDPFVMASKNSGLGRSYFEQWVNWSPSQPEGQDAEVVRLTPKANSGNPANPRPTRVTNLPLRRG